MNTLLGHCIEASAQSGKNTVDWLDISFGLLISGRKNRRSHPLWVETVVYYEITGKTKVEMWGNF